MAVEHPSGFAEVRKKIADAISRTYHQYLKTDRESVEDAVSLLASDRTIHPESMRVILDFYNSGGAQKEAFFTILSSLPAPKVEYIFNQIYAAMDSPAWLIRIRADLDEILRKMGAKAPQALRGVANIFTEHFAKIFNFQYLVTRFCNAQNTSISLLKFISEKEGVHPAEHWWNFENRLNSPDHIIITLEHFKMPYVPVVYVEVAFSKGLIRKMSRIIGDKHRIADLREADTAIFYSVNTTMPGLDGIALGAKMITRGREYIEQNYPHISYFATLSPIPGFRAYIEKVLSDSPQTFSLTRKKIDVNKRSRFLSAAEITKIGAELAKGGKKPGTLSDLLKEILGSEDWHTRPVLIKAMKHPMIELTRYYLTREKRIDPKTKGKTTHAYDQVANFHFSNGASIGSINYLANHSERGMRESFGMMVNYLYEGKRAEKNKRLYRSGEVVCEA